MASSYDFDVIVVGSGPGGSTAAIDAAGLGKRVALVERREHLGGMWIHGGTIAAKLLRTAIIDLRSRGATPQTEPKAAARFSMPDLVAQVSGVVERQTRAVAQKLARAGVTLYAGQGAFLDPHTIVVSSDFDTHRLTASSFVIATGSTPKRPPGVPFDGATVLDSDAILGLTQIPESLIVVGAGIIGLEYANMFGALGVRTTLVDRQRTLLDFVDRELIERLTESLEALGVMLRLGETVESVRAEPGRVIARLASGGEAVADKLLFCVGRSGNTHALSLGRAGIDADQDGMIPHDDHFRTRAPHIYAVGDVVGFPALASTAMMQGRIAAQQLAGVEISVRRQYMPYALFTIPELAMAGLTEEQLRQIGQSYVAGRARYHDTASGQIAPETPGMLKLLFRPDTKELLGVHSVGTSSAELVHIGQAVMEHGGTVDYFKDAVFALPTLAESYRLAALDGLSRMGA